MGETAQRETPLDIEPGIIGEWSYYCPDKHLVGVLTFGPDLIGNESPNLVWSKCAPSTEKGRQYVDAVTSDAGQ